MLHSYAKRLGAFCFILFTGLVFASDRTDVLLVAYDQGESNAFIQIEKELVERDISYRILAMGRAGEIFKDHPNRLYLSTKTPPQLKTDRSLLLPDLITEELAGSYSFKLIYSGMASAAQAQVINLYRNKDVETVAFYDNFEPVQQKGYVQPFLQKLSRVDQFHVASTTTANSFSDLAKQKQAEVIITGQPALEAWDKVYKTTDRQKLRSVLGLEKNIKTVLFAGGYDPTYPQYLRQYILGCRQAQSVLCLITFHPKTDGSLERSEVNLLDAENVRVISGNRYSTAELSTIAELVAVHKSTIAVMAAYKGKPVLYIAEPDFNSFLLDEKLASLASTPVEVSRAINHISLEQDSQHQSLFSQHKASGYIASLIQKLLQKQQQQQTGH